MIRNLLGVLFVAAAVDAQLPVPMGSDPTFAGGVFFANADDSSRDLWRTDGTPEGTQLVKDFDRTGPVPQEIVGVVNGKSIFLTASRMYAADANGITEIATIPSHGFVTTNVMTHDGALHFGIADSVWRTDGTAAGTERVEVDRDAFAQPHQIAMSGDRLFVLATGEAFRADLYVRTGAHGAFVHVARLADESAVVIGARAAGDRFFMMIGSDSDWDVVELWVSDGTAGGTTRLRRFSTRSAPLLIPIGAAGNRFLFTGYEETSGVELWASDGTAEGTRLFVDVVEGYRGSVPWLVGTDGARTFVEVSDFMGRKGLARIDADGAVTRLAPIDGFTAPGMSSNGRFFFPVTSVSAGMELWVTDGTPGGTHRVIDLNPGPGSGASTRLMATSRGVVFAGDDGTTGREPWVTDGTPQGTRLLKNIRSEGPPQSDDDGVTDDAENHAAPNGDGDRDGQPDRLSSFVASIRSRSAFTVVASCELRQVRIVPLPAERYFNWRENTSEAVEFQLPCAAANVTVIFHNIFEPTSPKTRLVAHAREVGGNESTARWFVMPAVTIPSGLPARATFALTDGGPGDDSPAGDGRIVHRSTLAQVSSPRDRSVRH